jgi:hypothetical protein|tara:strand:- start:160 stop:354 length:195 start_codon:yes stop_codon:yes gene_type:complete
MLVVVAVEKDVLDLVPLVQVELAVEVTDQNVVALLEQQELQILVVELVAVVYFHQDQQEVQELL